MECGLRSPLRPGVAKSWLKLSGSPDIVFLRLTFLGLRDTVSVLMRERRMLACRSNTSPVTLIGTMSVGTACAACRILSSGVGRGVALVQIT